MPVFRDSTIELGHMSLDNFPHFSGLFKSKKTLLDTFDMCFCGRAISENMFRGPIGSSDADWWINGEKL